MGGLGWGGHVWGSQVGRPPVRGLGWGSRVWGSPGGEAAWVGAPASVPPRSWRHRDSCVCLQGGLALPTRPRSVLRNSGFAF